MHDQSELLRNPSQLATTLDTFLSSLPLKHISPRVLPDVLSHVMSTISQGRKLVFIFDVEFQHLLFRANGSKQDDPHIMELGGIICIKRKHSWIYLSNFHFNLPPVASLENLRVFQSQYTTVSPGTKLKLQKIERQHLFADRLSQAHGEDFVKIYKSALASNLAKHRGLRTKLLPADHPDLQTHANRLSIINKFKGTSFTLRSHDIGAPAFWQMWKLYLTDTWVCRRQVAPLNRQWVCFFHKLLQQGTCVVKGDMDIIASNNLFQLHRLPKLHSPALCLYDIANFNPFLFKLCGSAKLEDTVICLFEKGLVSRKLQQALNTLQNMLVLQGNSLSAHNPLVDAFYTLIIAAALIK